ncbi:hypothetical protein [Streptococcus sp. HF-1907]|nr:hypothetical protein [Streptococcus sp. HF-1907]
MNPKNVARFSNSDKQDFKIFTEDPTGNNEVNVKVWDNITK